MHRERLREEEADWGDVATGLGTPGATGSRRRRKNSSPELAEGARPCPHLDLGLVPPELGEIKFLLF